MRRFDHHRHTLGLQHFIERVGDLRRHLFLNLQPPCENIETSVLDWRGRLLCSRCGSRNVDMVVTGTERR
jgi:hypothetical protein